MDRWYWKGIYHNGTEITELQTNPGTGRQWSSDHLDTGQLKALVLEPKRDGISRVTVEVRAGDTLKRRWRHFMNSLGQRSTCHLLSLTRDGIAFYTFFKPSGKVLISTRYNGACTSENFIHIDAKPSETAETYQVPVTGGNCQVYKLSKNGTSYYNFFMPNKEVIISTSDQGYLFVP